MDILYVVWSPDFQWWKALCVHYSRRGKFATPKGWICDSLGLTCRFKTACAKLLRGNFPSFSDNGREAVKIKGLCSADNTENVSIPEKRTLMQRRGIRSSDVSFVRQILVFLLTFLSKLRRSFAHCRAFKRELLCRRAGGLFCNLISCRHDIRSV